MTHALVEWLLSDVTLQSFVGLNTAGDTHKIYQCIVPQDEKPPYVCIRVNSVEPILCKGQASNEENDSVEVNCYGGSYSDTLTLYRVVRQVIDANSFTASDGTEIVGQFSNARDATPGEMRELAIRAIYGIQANYLLEVKLGDIT